MLNVTVKEAATVLAIKQSTLRKWISERRLSHVRLGRAVRIPMESIEKFVQDHYIPAVERSR